MMTKESLNQIAVNYHTAEIDDKWIEDANQVYSLDWILEQLIKSESVLELGYGEGIITDDLVKKGKKITLIEGSSILVKKVQDVHGSKVNCVHTLFEEFETEEKFDTIIASHVLEHVDNPPVLLNRMKQWLTPKGKIIIIVPNSESIHRRLATLMGLQPKNDTLSARDKLVGHQRVYSIQTLTDDLYECHLNPVVVRGVGFKSLPNSMMVDFDPKLIKAMYDISEFIPTELAANLGMVVEAI